MVSRSHSIFAKSLAVQAFVVLGLYTSNAQSQCITRYRSTICSPCTPVCVPAITCSTTFNAGTDSADLKLHVVGATHNTIEAYFKNELYFRDEIPESQNIHCGNNISLAPKNPLGTFAVRYGKHLNSVRIYGWKTDAETPITKDIDFDPACPIRLTWETTRILKIHCGRDQKQEYVIRFNDSDTPWTVLFPAS